jgi:hypothetical protein
VSVRTSAVERICREKRWDRRSRVRNRLLEASPSLELDVAVFESITSMPFLRANEPCLVCAVAPTLIGAGTLPSGATVFGGAVCARTHYILPSNVIEPGNRN